MGNHESLISVAMGTLYTQDDLSLLKRAVTSILNQTYSNFEFLICDNGSTAAAAEYLSSLSRAEPRIRLVRKSDCLDLASKLNLCLASAKGAYIARMDDDDFSRPDRFAKQLAFLEDYPEIGFVGSNVQIVQNGVCAGMYTLPKQPVVQDFYMTQPFIHPTLMFRRKILKAVGGYSEDSRSVLCEDYDLLLRLYAKGYQGANLQEVYLDYTIPVTAKGNRKMGHRWNEAVTRYKRFKDLGLLPEALPYVVKPLAVGLLPERVLVQIKKRRNMGG